MLSDLTNQLKVCLGPWKTGPAKEWLFTVFADVSQFFSGIRVLFEFLNEGRKSGVGLAGTYYIIQY